MKTLFIDTFLKKTKTKIPKNIKKLPKNIVIAYSIQYKKTAKIIEKELEKKYNIIKNIQILGCSKPPLPEKTSAILLITDGKFHAISLAYETKLPVYIIEKNKLKKIEKEEIKTLENRRKGAQLKFLNSKTTGIIISTKPGQQKFKESIKIKKELTNKKNYLFLCNNININEFENFKIDSWINTACPRFDLNTPIINISEVKTLISP